MRAPFIALSVALLLVPTPLLAGVDLTPRLGIFYATGGDAPRLPFTFGAAIQPAGPTRATFFLAPQLDLEICDGDTSFAPTARLGLLVRDGSDAWATSLLSYARVYGIVGYRMPGPQRSGARVGFGLDSAVGLLVTAIGLKAGVPLPNAIEVIWEGVDGEHPTVALHLGITL